MTSHDSIVQDGPEPLSPGRRFVIPIAVGFIFFLGAVLTWRNSQWPSFLPIQLDFINDWFFRPMGSMFGPRVGAVFLAVLGGFFVALPFFPRAGHAASQGSPRK